MTKQQLMEQMKAMQAALEAMEAEEAEVVEEEIDTRPLGEKIGSFLGKSAVVAKTQSTSFWGGLKQELIQGGIIKPSKKK
jgi:hypothetical protein